MVQPSTEPQDWERALEGLEVHAVIGGLPGDSYEQLLQEIRQIYINDSVPPAKLPL